LSFSLACISIPLPLRRFPLFCLFPSFPPLSLTSLSPPTFVAPPPHLSKEVGEQRSPFAFHSRVELILLLFLLLLLPYLFAGLCGNVYPSFPSHSFRLLCSSLLFAVVRYSSAVHHRFRFDSACSDVLALSTGSLSLYSSSLNLEGRGGGSSQFFLTHHLISSVCEKSNCNYADPGLETLQLDNPRHLVICLTLVSCRQLRC